jgi:undecaprenyl diphosphate synthase
MGKKIQTTQILWSLSRWTQIFKIANKAFELGVKKLTIFAFSTENWKRPKDEVDYLMSKTVEFLMKMRTSH